MQPAERLERGHRRARRRRGVAQRRAAALQLLALEPVEVRQAGRHAAPTRSWRRQPGASPQLSAKPTRQQSARRRHPVSGGLDPEATFPARPIRGGVSKYLLAHFPGFPTRRHDKHICRCFCSGIFLYHLFSLTGVGAGPWLCTRCHLTSTRVPAASTTRPNNSVAEVTRGPNRGAAVAARRRARRPLTGTRSHAAQV